MSAQPEDCPCCGGKAMVDHGTLNEYYAKKNGSVPEGLHKVICLGCGLMTPWLSDAVERWNKRGGKA